MNDLYSCILFVFCFFFFFFNDTATTEIYTLSLHDALPISGRGLRVLGRQRRPGSRLRRPGSDRARGRLPGGPRGSDRKSTRLNSSHSQISYAVFCLKKKNRISRLSISRDSSTTSDRLT